MKRKWVALQAIGEDGIGLLLKAIHHYPFAVYFCGSGWNSEVRFGFGGENCRRLDENSFESLDKLLHADNDFVVCHCAYELKDKIESVHNTHPNEDGFSDLFFFVPDIIVERRDESWYAGFHNELQLDFFLNKFTSIKTYPKNSTLELTARTSATEYKKHCSSLLDHIHRGDIYEINYCIDFVGNDFSLDPVEVFQQLNSLAEAPMSTLYRNGNSWLMCASPERFIARKGNKLISQPIKGTIRRGTNISDDKLLRDRLYNDPKERSENVMIVDLVRNDLSRIAAKGSVKVSELFGIQTFNTVHQMVSTVECEVKAETKLSAILKATFPMGSMTGAPKISAMNLADKYESQSRGIYSGTVGYILPNGDFDFNVVIRSITWNSATGHVSAKAGGAITANSVAEKEYEECLLKAKAMMAALNPARV